MGPERVMPMAQISWQRIITPSGLGLLTLVLLWVGPAPAQEGHQHDQTPNVMEYLDRLDRPERDQDQKPAQVIDALVLKPACTSPTWAPAQDTLPGESWRRSTTRAKCT